MDAADGGVLLEDDVDGVELGGSGEDTRDICGPTRERVKDGAEALTSGALRDDAVGTRRADELRYARAVLLLFLLPRVPCVVEPGLPMREAFAEIVFGLVERPAKRMVREIDA
jgi:hypothetical protein